MRTANPKTTIDTHTKKKNPNITLKMIIKTTREQKRKGLKKTYKKTQNN